MFYTISKNTIMILASFSILSCGTMNNPDHLQEVPTEVSHLASTLRVYQRSLPSLPQASQIPKQSEVKSCSEGGEMHYTNDYNQTEMIQNPNNFAINLTSQALNCTEEGITVNGDMQFKIDFIDDLSRSLITYLTDFTISEGSKQQVLVKQGSFSTNQTIDDNTDIVTDSSEIITQSSTQKTFFFKTKEFSKGNTTQITNISGRKTVDGKTFIVDESYDHAENPMTYDKDGNLQIGGKQRYTNEENHTITIEAVGINQILISIDEDGDGKIDNVKTVVSL